MISLVFSRVPGSWGTRQGVAAGLVTQLGLAVCDLCSHTGPALSNALSLV